MKTITGIITILLLLPVVGFSQQNPLDGFIDNYKDQPGFQYMDVTTNMISDDNSQTINLKMLTLSEKENPSLKGKDFYDSFFKKFDKSDYKGLIEVRSSGDNVEMMVKQNGEIIEEFIITVRGDIETMLIAATGKFSMKDLGKFADIEDCKGFRMLEKLCEE